MKLIIGHSGLVGTTLTSTTSFDYYFNSTNIQDFSSICKDGAEITLTCLPATKWLVNQNISKDIDNINNLLAILSKYKYSKITLISTIDVYQQSPLGANEDYIINLNRLDYGANRYLFELLVQSTIVADSFKIFRLPAVFSASIKKNILYDLMNNNNVSSINNNSAYQWYNLDNLNNDITTYSAKYPDRIVYNLFSEPLDTAELVALFPHHQHQVLHGATRVAYNYTTTLHSSGYIYTKQQVLQDIKTLVHETSNKQFSLE